MTAYHSHTIQKIIINIVVNHEKHNTIGVVLSHLSVAIDTESDTDKATYDAQFDDNHTVHERKVSTCTYTGSPCLTCD